MQIKVVGHTEELQLITFCDNWKMLKQELCTHEACCVVLCCVVKSNLIAEFQI